MSSFSVFNCISTFVGYLIPKVNVIGLVGIRIAYYNVKVQYVCQCAKVTSIFSCLHCQSFVKSSFNGNRYCQHCFLTHAFSRHLFIFSQDFSKLKVFPLSSFLREQPVLIFLSQTSIFLSLEFSIFPYLKVNLYKITEDKKREKWINKWK